MSSGKWRRHEDRRLSLGNANSTYDAPVSFLNAYLKLQETAIGCNNPSAATKRREQVHQFDLHMSPVYNSRRLPPLQMHRNRIYDRIRFLPSLLKKQDVTSRLIKEPPPRPKSPSPIPERNKICSQKTSESSIASEPSFYMRVPTDKLLLRRPLLGPHRETSTSSDADVEPLYMTFSKTETELQPVPFDSKTAALKFYNSQYPILLQRAKPTDETRLTCNSPIAGKRPGSPESPLVLIVQRKMFLSQRVKDLEERLEELEEGTEDVDFITELDNKVYDPLSWAFSKSDDAALRRRYTLAVSAFKDF